MKRIILILTLVILAIPLLPYMPAKAQPTHTPHEDPSIAQTDFDITLPILLHYGDILDILATGNYEDAKAIIKQIDLDKVNIPVDLKFTMQTYNGLLSDLAETLDSLDNVLDETELLLAQNKLEETQLKLIDAMELILEAEGLLEDADKANEELVSLLAPFTLPTEVEAVNEARDRLHEAMDRLKNLEASYEAALQSLEAQIPPLVEPSSTSINLEIESQAWVGDSVTASGILTSTEEEGQVLPYRKINILLNGENEVTTTTDDDGRYATEIEIPYLHIPRMTVQASYVPEGEDIAKYLSSLSPVVEIEVQFYTTELSLNLDDTNPLVGDTITASGMLTSPEEAGIPLPGRDITISLDVSLMTTVTTQADGSYQKTLEIPYEQIALRTIQASYTAIEDEYAPSSSHVEIEVQFYPTELTLEIDPSEAWVGDTVVVSGKLTSTEEEEKPLPEKKIAVISDDEVIATLNTDTNGFYQGTVNIPYLYTPEITIQAMYIPEGEDKSKYQSCYSDSVDMNISFHQTQLQIEVPERAYPELPIKISGKITYEAGIPSVKRVIRVLWDNESLASFYPSQDTFEMEVMPDAQTIVGEHLLTVIVAPQGHYSSVSENETLIIVKCQPEIEVNSLAFITPPRNVRIKGKIISELPLQEARVTVELRNVSTTVSTSAEGEFEATLSLPLDSIVIGRQEVRIKIEPSETWHISTEIKAEVFVLDIVNIGLTSAAFICLGVVLYTRRRGRPRREEIEFLETALRPQETTKAAQQKFEGLEGTRERVLKAYTEATEVAENITKISMKPHMTLREFLKEATPRLNNAAESFTQLTKLAEEALYSPNTPGLDEAIRAESLALIMKEVLRYGMG